MPYFEYIKAGTRRVPAFYIIIYWLSRIADNLTTYLATPDLKNEGNWFIVLFNLGWKEIIIKDILILLFVTIGVFYSSSAIYNYLLHHKNHIIIRDFVKQKKLFLSFILLCGFFTHIFYSLFLTISNYLQFLFLHQSTGFLHSLSVLYVEKFILKFRYIFFFYSGLFLVLGFMYTIFFVKKLKSKAGKTEVPV